jgi:DNA repair ATPase RecN
VIEATTPRWTFGGGIHDAAHEALAALHYEEDDQMEHSQYWHFPSGACEGVDAEVVVARGRDHVGYLPDQVKLNYALNQDLDEAMKEIRQVGNHVEEVSQRITKLEALCKQHEEAAQRLMRRRPLWREWFNPTMS